MGELMKIVKVNETSLNVDSLISSKVDCKVVGMIFSEVMTLEKVELMAEKTSASDIDKQFNIRERIRARGVQKSDESSMKRISANPGEMLYLLNGLGKNMQ
jgi:hypothetical protein